MAIGYSGEAGSSDAVWCRAVFGETGKAFLRDLSCESIDAMAKICYKIRLVDRFRGGLCGKHHFMAISPILSPSDS